MNPKNWFTANGFALCITFVCNMLCYGAYLEREGAIWKEDPVDHRPPRFEPGPPLLPPPPTPGVPAVIERVINAIHVAEPYTFRGLTIFPLEYRQRQPNWKIHTLDEATGRGLLDIRERDDAEVGAVMVRNTSRRPVFLMSGELLTGGRQNRLIRDDILLEARSGSIPVAVYCIEQERWQGKPRAEFYSGKTAGSPALRGKALVGEPQTAIWREVDEQHRAAGVDSRTHDYQQLYTDRDTAKDIDAFTSRIIAFLPRRIIGLAVARGERIISIDIFGTEDLCSALREKLIRSYALENLKYSRHGNGSVDTRDVERLLNRTISADFIAQDTPGSGIRMNIRGTVRGSALVWKNELVHLALVE